MPIFRDAPEVGKKANEYALSIADRLPPGAHGLAAIVRIEIHGPFKSRFALDVWHKASNERLLHTCNEMRFFKHEPGNFPVAAFTQVADTTHSLDAIAAAQDNCPILILPIRMQTRVIEEPMLHGEFGLDLTSAIYFMAAQSTSWLQEDIEIACEGERFGGTAIPSVGTIKGDRRIRTLLPGQETAISLTGFVL